MNCDRPALGFGVGHVRAELGPDLLHGAIADDARHPDRRP
jgi:hypothetical protein